MSKPVQSAPGPALSGRRAKEFQRLHTKWLERLGLDDWTIHYEGSTAFEGARTVYDRLDKEAYVMLGKFGPLTPQTEALALCQALHIAVADICSVARKYNPKDIETAETDVVTRIAIAIMDMKEAM